MKTDMEKYIAACTYPGHLDEAAVNRHLADYCSALKINRRIEKISSSWWRQDDLLKAILDVANDIQIKSRDAMAARDAMDAMAARDAMAAMAARDARDARAAMAARDAILFNDFAIWCIFRGGYWYWEMSWIVTTHLGAKVDKPIVWAKSMFDAFLAGAWILVWTPKTLYWIEKPKVFTHLRSDGVSELHCSDGPALISNVQNLYFLDGVPVPAYAVVRPEWITKKEIAAETDMAVKKVLIERRNCLRASLASLKGKS